MANGPLPWAHCVMRPSGTSVPAFIAFDKVRSVSSHAYRLQVPAIREQVAPMPRRLSGPLGGRYAGHTPLALARPPIYHPPNGFRSSEVVV
jgi:hypothetical protein